jgi:hypothetical protein
MSCFQEENDQDDLRVILIPRNSSPSLTACSSSVTLSEGNRCLFWARLVLKDFGGTTGIFEGIVTSFHRPYWTVTYTDGETVLVVMQLARVANNQ